MQQREYKVVFTGSMGAGKTSAIAAISEIAPILTDVSNTDTSTHPKATTTTALDYGEVTLAGGDKLRLYGTPGQARFDFMWKILGNGALGVIVLVDNSRTDPLADLTGYLSAFRSLAAASRAVIGVGRCESHPEPTLDAFHDATRALGFSALPILSVDVRRREDVLLLLDVLLHQIEASELAEESAT